MTKNATFDHQVGTRSVRCPKEKRNPFADLLTLKVLLSVPSLSVTAGGPGLAERFPFLWNVRL